uniref:3'-5' exonuclease domain-containing protein n=1 Tax=Anopheles farauti TaxID=69004 RepID=A0A182QAQ9_9DIPT
MNKVELELGQTVLVELEEECLVGELVHIGSDRSFMRLSNVRDMVTKKNYGIQTYYNSEIRNIQVMVATEQKTLDVSPTVNVVKSKQLTLDYLEETIAQINEYVFIHQTDMKYHDSIRYLKKQRHFGIAMECIEHGRHSKSPSLLSIATFDSIFIFDIKWMEITADIRSLLTEHRYRRVLYNGRVVRDVLQYKFGVTLGKCFDIMIAHVAISKTEGKVVDPEISLQSCVEQYLNLPDKFFDMNINFSLRPLKDETKREAAKNVVFLLPLQDLFIHEIMLESYYTNCDKYSRSLARNRDFINSLNDLRNGCRAIEEVDAMTLGIDMDSLDALENDETGK